ncbi:MAG: hypothetical protein M3325_14505, partial [Actinomycetota bacterium]|nr:hypothetical protein [Actinomycetota bacterium]
MSASHGLECVAFWRGLLALRPRRWRLWGERKIVIGYVLAVDLVAVGLAAVVIAAIPVGLSDLPRFGLLAAGAIAHREVVR